MNIHSKFKTIKALVFDIDGVMTEGTLMASEIDFHRSMNLRDGLALKIGIEAGLIIGIISGGASPGARKRLEILGINQLYLGVQDKVPSIHNFSYETGIALDQILYMGDDLPDVPVLEKVGLSTCPKDAIPEVVQVCSYISPKNGGQGCVRDVIEKVLRVNNLWDQD